MRRWVFVDAIACHKFFSLCSALLLLAINATTVLSVDDPVEFGRDIRPILSDTCFKCHGPDDAQRSADLRLDIESGIKNASELIAPGDVRNSEFLSRILSDDEDEIMPPADSGRTLTPDQKDLLRKWIEQGAPFEKHWSFVAISKPEIPISPAANRSWATNEIDAFVLDQMRGSELTPNETADRNTLIRRVSLDLTGLPPAPSIVEQFAKSERADWYQQLVDALMAQPSYGEHMARYWLDAARYADTHGLHLDNYREMWLYRDWVVQAFNDNLPFDQFIVEQLAGDLLPDPTESQLIATGFNRAHVTTNEGGSIDEEIRVRNVVDRVSTMGTVFMGLTVGCAQCHDHKYDPISQKDFYSLYAFFNSLDAKAMDGNTKEHAPTLRYMDSSQKQLLSELEVKRERNIKLIDQKIAAYEYVDSHEDSIAAESNGPAKDVVWVDDELPAGVAKTGDWKQAKADEVEQFSGKFTYVDYNKAFSQIYILGAERGLRFGAEDKFFVNVFLDADQPPKEIMLQFNDGDWEQRAYWGENLIAFGQNETSSRKRLGDLPATGRWLRLEVDVSDVGFKSSSEIRGIAFSQNGGKVFWDSAGVVTALPQTYTGNSLSSWINFQHETGALDLPNKFRKRFLEHEEGDSPSKSSADPEQPEQEEATSDSESKKEAEETKEALAKKEKLDQEIKDYFIRNVNRESVDLISEQVTENNELKSQIDEIKSKAPTTLIWKEKSKPVEAFVLSRGEYDQKGESVIRGTPAALPPFSESLSRDRLGLAEWLIDPSHPLTARVTVNKIWQQFFGVGIVATSDDFGAQGQSPSHPELLDWLASDFAGSGWNVKRLVRKIVMSSAYRQSAKTTKKKQRIDPTNRLLSRASRYRLDAEVLRDQALAIGGLLSSTVGGPGVKPPQPDGLWFAVGYSRSNTVRFKKDSGSEKVHRRSLYTFWKRTSPPPQMSTFDAPTRESCVVRRERTNTPLQALLLMNDPQYIEAARFLAQLTFNQELESVDEDIRFMYKRVMARPPAEELMEVLRENFELNKSEFTQNLESAKKLVKIGETPADAKYEPTRLAALTMLANLLMNQDEFVSRN